MKTGIDESQSADQTLDQTPATTGHSAVQIDTQRARGTATDSRSLTISFTGKSSKNQLHQGGCLIGAGAGDSVPEPGPSTQVDYSESQNPLGNEAVSEGADQGLDQAPGVDCPDLDLTLVVEAWHQLPPTLRRTILHLVRSASC